ncbi:unnamed protein product [Mytilus edulis]|uniref:Uncharacterized protein n=1 Tax=Mytilus edulis TaxID=6550 RepID=A0A8S3QXV1_MYTED|nr:unnamed protein product [Mytilus edulis]
MNDQVRAMESKKIRGAAIMKDAPAEDIRILYFAFLSKFQGLMRQPERENTKDTSVQEKCWLKCKSHGTRYGNRPSQRSKIKSYLADAAASSPVTNAWPERGGSCLKNIKTRLRNRLSYKMLQACMHVCINGSDMDSLIKSNVIPKAVETWIGTTNKR